MRVEIIWSEDRGRAVEFLSITHEGRMTTMPTVGSCGREGKEGKHPRWLPHLALGSGIGWEIRKALGSSLGD